MEDPSGGTSGTGGASSGSGDRPEPLDVTGDGGSPLPALTASPDTQKKKRGRWGKVRVAAAFVGEQETTLAKKERTRIKTMVFGRTDAQDEGEVGAAAGNQPHCLKGLIVHPQSPSRRVWDTLWMIMLIYCAAIIPVRVAFDALHTMPWTAIDVSATVFFLLDIVFNFFTAIESETGLLVSYPPDLACKYSRTWLLPDLLGAFPFELLVTPSTPSDLRTVLQLLSMFRLYRLFRMKVVVDRHGLADHGFTGGLRRTHTSIITLFATIVLLSHFIGCGWFWVSREQALQGNQAWIVVDGQYSIIDGNISNTTSLESQYLATLYWALATMATVGYGDIQAENDAERLYALFAMFVGISVFGFVVGQLSQMIVALNTTALAQEARLNDVENFMLRSRLPTLLRGQIREHFTYMFSKERAADEEGILDQLPVSLRLQCCALMNSDAFQCTPFNICEPQLRAALASRLRPVRFAAAAVIFEQGDASLEITPDAARVLNAGTIFGEIGAIFGVRRTATVRCITQCECYSITAAAFLESVSGTDEDILNAVREIGSMRFTQAAQLRQRYVAEAAGQPVSSPAERIEADFQRHQNAVVKELAEKQKLRRQRSARGPKASGGENMQHFLDQSLNDELGQAAGVIKETMDRVEANKRPTPAGFRRRSSSGSSIVASTLNHMFAESPTAAASSSSPGMMRGFASGGGDDGHSYELLGRVKSLEDTVQKMAGQLDKLVEKLS